MEWVRYNNQGAIRSQPLSPKLLDALSFLPELGVEMEVFSGGQAPKGSGGPRTGSTRHDHGNAADVFFYKDGQRLDWNNPAHQPIFKQIVQMGKPRGITGVGAGEGYMRPGSMHIGFGTPAIWGAGGSGENAAGWLREAYHGEAGHVHKPGDENQKIADATMAAIGKPRQGQTSLLGGEGNDRLEAPMQQQPQQRGLLFNMLPEKAQGMMTPERVARLQMALEGATLNPNQGVMRAAEATIEGAADSKKRNATAEWLAKNGRNDLAQAVATGAIDGRTAVAEAMKKPDPTEDLRVINGQVVNIRTGEVTGDYRTEGGAEMPASVQELQWRAEQAGLKPGTPEYQSFVLNGGGDPANFRALDMQARRAGFEPGSPEYKEFMATRGAGLQAGAKTNATNVANIETGGKAAEVVAEGAARGKENVEKASEVAEMERNLPGLLQVADELYALAEEATYTLAGRVYDEGRKQLGLEPSDGALARAKYIAVVDNQVLPLLRQTFGAAFTAKEGDTLRATLGDPDKSPAEKKAVLNAFIEQKKRDLLARGGRIDTAADGDGWINVDGVKVRVKP